MSSNYEINIFLVQEKVSESESERDKDKRYKVTEMMSAVEKLLRIDKQHKASR